MTLAFINTNLNAQRALKTLRTNTQAAERASAQMASGRKVQFAKDDASGYAISKRLDNDILTRQRGAQNVQDAQGMMDIAEGGASTILNNLQRVRELTVQAASDAYGPDQRNAIGQEIRSLVEDIQRVSSSASFNGSLLLNGSITDAKVQLAGGSDVQTNTIELAPAFASMDAESLEIYGTTADPDGLWRPASLDDLYNATTGTGINSSGRALAFLKYIDKALAHTNAHLATMGALGSQLSNYTDFVATNLINLQSSRSRIVDVDMAKASADYTQSGVLQQAAVSILSQANQSQQNVLQLLNR